MNDVKSSFNDKCCHFESNISSWKNVMNVERFKKLKKELGKKIYTNHTHSSLSKQDFSKRSEYKKKWLSFSKALTRLTFKTLRSRICLVLLFNFEHRWKLSSGELIQLLEQLTATHATTILETYITFLQNTVNTSCFTELWKFGASIMLSHNFIRTNSPFLDFLWFFDPNFKKKEKNDQDSIFNHKGLK